MFASPVVSALVNAIGLSTPQSAPDDSCWKLDKMSVMGGGCVTIILDDVCSSMRGLKLQIDDYGPVDLRGFVGPTIQRHYAPGPLTTTFILISHDFRSPEGYELVAEEPETYRMVPIFDEPGTVRLTLTTSERSLGTKAVTVVPLAPEAEPAVRLLFPTIVKDQGPIRNWAKAMGLLGGADHGPSARSDGPNLPQFKKELEVLREHPDWAEIFEMLVAWLEARMEVDELSSALKSAGGDVDPSMELPPLPETVTKALEAEPASRFAKVIQDSIRGTIAQRKFLLRRDHRMPAEDD